MTVRKTAAKKPAAKKPAARKPAKRARRVVVYAGTRNLYHMMAVSLKALLHSTEIDRVVLLTEDDTFPEQLPAVCEVLNVSDQKFFPADGPNFENYWTWMAMMRLTIPVLLPDESRALYLDCDTIAMQDIGGIFETDLQGNLLAGVLEPHKSDEKQHYHYFNAGVVLMDLDALRTSGKCAEMISALNYRKWGFPDQDVMNACCSRKTLVLPPEWNAAYFIPHGEPIILHGAANRHFDRTPEFRAAASLEWGQCKC